MTAPALTTVFLDRDGVINEDSPDYIRSWEAFRFLPGSLQAVVELSRRGFRIFVITNQSGIGRGLIAPEELARMHNNLAAEAAAAGGRIDGFFFCPHRPEEGCRCRKPRPGLIEAAARAHGIDLSRAVMVGDSARDILAARRAGCGLAVLVRTGNGSEAEKSLAAGGSPPDHVADDLASAVGWIRQQAL